MMRRGLLAGLATAVAAAAVKVTGAGKAEATDGGSIVIGDTTQTAQSETRLTAPAALSDTNVAFKVVFIDPGSDSSAAAIAGVSGTSFSGVQGVSLTGPGVKGDALSGG